MLSEFVYIHPEVRDALAAGRPVVALESTVIAHGLPRPLNLDCARELEALVRANDATPATVAVLGGRLRIGLTDAELTHLATTDAVAKLSRRDLATVMAQGGDGATTVAATLICARLAGIGVFATGGIGGVHRGAEHSFDVSADLTELARSPVTVVCAGAKSILDLPKTLEVLETWGVPVLGYGCDRFPGFYVRDTGLGVDARVDDPEAVARIVQARRTLGLDGGEVVAVPAPESAALDPEQMEAWIGIALAEAQAAAVHGKALTPYLLARLAELSDGQSLQANLALLRHNAAVASQLAKAIANCRTTDSEPSVQS